MWNPFKRKSKKVLSTTSAAQQAQSHIWTGYPTITGTAVGSASYGTINITSGGYLGGSAMGGVSMGPMTMPAPVYTVGGPSSTKIISFFKTNGDDLVVLNRDGSVTWDKEIEIKEGAKAFATMLTLGAEHRAGITEGLKRRMRDQVFDEIIQMAKERGALTADDLTFMLESSKIIEKLKGTNE